jgi:hypothetical protein
MNSDSRDRWSTTRKQGKWAYVILTGVTFWGATAFVVMGIFVHTIDDFRLGPIFLLAAPYLILGGLIAYARWSYQERAFSRVSGS